jgi:hypothetical protein
MEDLGSPLLVRFKRRRVLHVGGEQRSTDLSL